MASKRKSESARINGAKSKGPKTAEGKAASSQNALSHGLTANFTVAGEELQDDFELLLDSYADRYQPADAIEMELVQTLAITRWRLRRIGNLETNLIDNELALSGTDIDKEFSTISADGRLAYVFGKLAEQGKALSLLIRYEGALNRVYDRTLKQLAELQNGPRRNEPTEPLTPDSPTPPPQPTVDPDEPPAEEACMDRPHEARPQEAVDALASSVFNSPTASPHDR
jgi:hypothetical protein